MSIQAIAWVLENSRSTGHARLVLISLANHYNQGTGDCNPGHRRIASEAGVSLGSVGSQIRKLAALGEVSIETPGTSHRAAVYRLHFVQQVNVVPEVRSNSTPTTFNSGPSTFIARGQNLEPREEPRESARLERHPRGSRIPRPFDVTPPMLDWLRREQPGADYETETRAFVDYWLAQPGARGLKSDWEATWRNWMRKAPSFRR